MNLKFMPRISIVAGQMCDIFYKIDLTGVTKADDGGAGDGGGEELEANYEVNGEEEEAVHGVDSI